MATPNIVPRADSEGTIGSLAKRWLHGFFRDASVGKLTADEAIIDGSPAATLTQAYPRLTPAFLSAPKTLTETPAALFAGASQMAGRCLLILRNESLDTRARIGALQTDLQRDGIVLEPGAALILQLDPAVSTAIYGCSEGRAIPLQIGEDQP